MDQTNVPSGWGAFAHKVYLQRYSMDGLETWEDTAHRVPTTVFGAVADRPGVAQLTEDTEKLIAKRILMPGGRYLYAAGRPLHQVQNCLLNMVEDTREGWAEHVYKHTMGLSTGAGMGTVYSKIRGKGAILKRTGGITSGPLPLAVATNELGRGLRQGGNRRAALWGGLHWWHGDIFDWIEVKNWSEDVKRLKAQDYDFPAPMDMTNISVCFDDEFLAAWNNEPRTAEEFATNLTKFGIEYKQGLAYANKFGSIKGKHILHDHAIKVYWMVIRSMLETGEPGFSMDFGVNAGEWLRNACTEITTYDDSDICNIASINIARVATLEEFKEILPKALGFLLAGTVYSDVPYAKVDEVRTKNRRLGLGLMGVHEWLLMRGKKYGPDPELEEWLKEYQKSTAIAGRIADSWELSRPVKTRAMAPNGTIGIIAETTTCMETLLYVAGKRRVKEGDQTWAQYVIDPVAQRLIENGVKPEDVETAYSLAETPEGVERRVSFQAWFQQFVDHGIASTINLAPWGSETNNEGTVARFGNMLLKYLPQLRGITVYPDGARAGQPMTPVAYKTALKHVGQIVYEQGDMCDITRGESCGA